MYKLIVIDDEKQAREALCDYFSWDQIGFEICGRFSNGKEALDYLKTNHVDVILSDIVMPVMTGLELAEKLKQMKHPSLIVFLSGHKDFEFVRQGMAFGVRYYILKPTKHSEILEVFTAIKNELEQNSIQVNSESEELVHYGYKHKVIDSVKRYITDHFADASLEGAAELIHMNSSYLSSFFKQSTGENFSDFVMEVRMKQAAELLEDIQFRISDVSEMVGYSNPRNFARAFRQFFGTGPTSFRKQEKDQKEK